MPIKTILVHVDTSAGCAHRLRLATDLARRFGAQIIGVGLADDDLEITDDWSAAPTEESFRAHLQRAAIPGQWRPSSGLEEAFIVRQAQTADLVIVGQRDPDQTAGLGPEEVIVACGRPVLVVPHATPCERIGDTVLIAWNGSREATRAVHDARPLLAEASAVIVLSVTPDAEDDWGGRALAHALAQQGLPARAETIAAGHRTLSETVLSRARELGADLIVMGAFSRSPLREMILGGLTHAVLRDMAVPVLMAH